MSRPSQPFANAFGDRLGQRHQVDGQHFGADRDRQARALEREGCDAVGARAVGTPLIFGTARREQHRVPRLVDHPRRAVAHIQHAGPINLAGFASARVLHAEAIQAGGAALAFVTLWPLRQLPLSIGALRSCSRAFACVTFASSRRSAAPALRQCDRARADHQAIRAVQRRQRSRSAPPAGRVRAGWPDACAACPQRHRSHATTKSTWR